MADRRTDKLPAWRRTLEATLFLGGQILLIAVGLFICGAVVLQVKPEWGAWTFVYGVTVAVTGAIFFRSCFLGGMLLGPVVSIGLLVYLTDEPTLYDWFYGLPPTLISLLLVFTFFDIGPREVLGIRNSERRKRSQKS